MGYRGGQQQQQEEIVERLDLAYRDINEINPQIVERFGSHVKELDLSNNNLEKDLTILEGFKKLTTLVLDSNRITHNIKFPVLPLLHTLWVNNNNIVNLSVFIDKVYESFQSIRTFSMLKNEACPNFFNGHSLREYKDYRLYIISRLKNIQILDSTPVTSEERIDAIKLYGNFTTVSQSLAAATQKPLPLAVDISIEDDPKKKRELTLQQIKEEKELMKLEKLERRERRRLKRIEKEEKTYKKLKEKQNLKQQQQQQQDTDSTITNKDDFTSDEEEEEEQQQKKQTGKQQKQSKNKHSLPTFSSDQSPASTIIPPNPHKQSAYDSLEMADDEAFTAESSDHSDLPMYKNNLSSLPPPPPKIKQSDDSENEEDEEEEEEEEDDSENSSDSESSDWSSSSDDDDDDEEVRQINSKLQNMSNQRNANDDDDDDEEDEENELAGQYTHFPVRPPPPPTKK